MMKEIASGEYRQISAVTSNYAYQLTHNGLRRTPVLSFPISAPTLLLDDVIKKFCISWPAKLADSETILSKFNKP